MADSHEDSMTMDEWMARMARRRAGWSADDLAAEIDPVAAIEAGRDDMDRAS